MHTFNLIGVMEKDNYRVFSGLANFVPRKGEELQINGAIFVVKYVRYLMSAGISNAQTVHIGLAYK